MIKIKKYWTHIFRNEGVYYRQWKCVFLKYDQQKQNALCNSRRNWNFYLFFHTSVFFNLGTNKLVIASSPEGFTYKSSEKKPPPPKTQS